MASKWNIATNIWEKFMDVHSTAIFIMFIYEEAMQVMNFAIYQAMKEKEYEKARELVDHLENELIKDAIDFAEFWGHLGMPVNYSFLKFYEAEQKFCSTLKRIL